MHFAEIFGAALGLAGTVLLALRGRWAGWGFVAYLGSNVSWLVFSHSFAHWAMFVQYLGFTLTSLLGIWTWIVHPFLQREETAEERLAARSRRSAAYIDHALWEDSRALDQRAGSSRDVVVVSRAALHAIYVQGEEQGRALERDQQAGGTR
ncbi:hypothetical protein QRO08_03630 [Paracidovorax citrulli]|uniref:Nicotinamide riboside transporter PnuC n=2 Tax=Paracidovorax citrulli TaxID=80869 RepID=A1TUN0_PARC0|nr:hypothetical protein [Paracidovorax citrulli]ABM34668.1 hypothetical protein Aave_4127 [Paracidovorax citrulli AAC00-1]ATG96750.1 hypothetical protein CQB05_24295 [Paracidovorax citrulli]PVY64114.1 hypothetical protein C8E08_1425 [Paracidovorax citrulli]REG71684.1 hypothetical protein C8E07_4942 [Paracidovorax citrulli]RLJ96237.1 hypothetical protein C8E06_4937 [Paracidovorax citrulli]